MGEKFSYLLLVHWRDFYCEDHSECVALDDDEPATILAALDLVRDCPGSGFLHFTARPELYVQCSKV